MLEKLLTKVNDNLGEISKRELPRYNYLKAKGVKFYSKAYEVKDLGRLSYLKMRAPLGLMHMESIVITPLDKDIPLINFDIIKVFKNYTILIEMYDVNLEKITIPVEFDSIKDKYNDLLPFETENRWYDEIKYKESIAKKGKKVLDRELALCDDYLIAYINLAKNAMSCNRELKAAKSNEYAMNLVIKGGASTDFFKQAFGDEFTLDYFRECMFGTKL